MNIASSLRTDKYVNPVFIVGLPRSGSTLLQGILCNSGFFFPMPETHFFSVVTSDLPSNNLKKEHLEQIQKKLQKKSRIKLKRSIPESLTSVKEVFEFVIDQFNNCSKRTFLEKTPRHVFFYNEISGYYPDARFICMIREPKNAVSSHLTMSDRRDKSVTRVSMLYNKIVSVILDIMNNSNVFVLKFEELTDNANESLKSVCKFIDIPFDERIIANVNAPREIIMGHELWKTKNIKESKVEPNNPERWKEVLNDNQAKLVDFVTRKKAQKSGYSSRLHPMHASCAFFKDMPKLVKKRERKKFFSKFRG